MSKIPKIYHWIWLNFKDETQLDTPIPKNYRETIEETKMLNPDWTFVEWNGRMIRELLETKYPWFLSTFDSYRKPIQRADASRYFILYTYGGIYTDLDSICKKPLTPLLDKYRDYDCIIAKEEEVRRPTNSIMLSKPGSDFMRYITENLEDARFKYQFMPGQKSVFYTTGPRFIAVCLDYYDGIDNVGFLTDEVVNTQDMNRKMMNYEYFINMNEGTWKHEFDEEAKTQKIMLWSLFFVIIGLLVYYKRRK